MNYNDERAKNPNEIFIKRASITSIIITAVYILLTVGITLFQKELLPLIPSGNYDSTFILPITEFANLSIFAVLNIVFCVIALNNIEKKGSLAYFLVPVILYAVLSFAMPFLKALETKFIFYKYGAEILSNYSMLTSHLSFVSILSVTATMITASVGAVRHLQS